jgi:cytochrome c peroxidase
MDVFVGKGRCDHCHGGAATTAATVAEAAGDPLVGFFNSAVSPAAEDPGDILQGNGFFKTPGIRNTELNGPYFHNGDKATLRQVVDFYDRGGDFPSDFTDGQVRPLQLTEAEKSALVAFMVAYTDERVRFQQAPFDHPSLSIPNGPGLKEVGAAGSSKPVKTFLGLSPFQP